MRTFEFLTSRALCLTILHHNRLYRSSDYRPISNYIYRTNYSGPVKFDRPIMGVLLYVIAFRIRPRRRLWGTNLMITFFPYVWPPYIERICSNAPLDKILDPGQLVCLFSGFMPVE